MNGIVRAPGSTFTLSGTAVPLALSVSVMSNGTALGSSGIDVTGHWSVPLTVTQQTTVTVVASGGATSPVYTLIPPGG
jgi:hypothetical protein